MTSTGALDARPDGGPPVDVTLVIPTRDRPDALAACLASVVAAGCRGLSVEVVVVDDGSRTPVAHVIESFRGRLDLTLLRQENRGPAAARNAGAEIARGRLLAFTDDDCRLAPDWLELMTRRSDDQRDTMLGGRTENALLGNPFSTASQDLVDYLYASFQSDPSRAWFFTSNNMLMPTLGFRAVGGFDDRFPSAAAEDRDLCDRWKASGRALSYVPEALVHHSHRLGLRSFWTQHFNYGRGAARFHLHRRRRTGTRHRLEPLGFYLGLLRCEFRRREGGRAPLLAGLLALSQIANAAGYFVERGLSLLPSRRELSGRETIHDHG